MTCTGRRSNCGSARGKQGRPEPELDKIGNSTTPLVSPERSPENGLRQSSLSPVERVVSTPVEWDPVAIRALARKEIDVLCEPLAAEVHSLRSWVEEVITTQSKSPRTDWPAKRSPRDVAEHMQTVNSLKDVRAEVESITNYLNQLASQFNATEARVQELSVSNKPGNQIADEARPGLESLEQSSSSFDVRRLDKQVEEMVVLQDDFRKMTIDIEQLKKQALGAHNKPLGGDIDEPSGEDADVLTSKENKDENAIEIPKHPTSLKSAASVGTGAIDHVNETYKFDDSINDMMLFFGLEHFMGGADNVIVIACFCITLFMQTCVCFVLAEPVFRSMPFDTDFMQGLRQWRLTDAHSNTYADPSRGPSLASRVCNADPGLTLATRQQNIYDAVSDYNDYGGGVLAIVSLTFFVICCCMELRKCFNFLVAFGCLPFDKKTIVLIDGSGKFRLTAVSRRRFLLASILFTIRLTVVGFLGFNGSTWLLYTEHIEDLILNASALSFVLSIDNIVYIAFVPTRFAKTLRNFRPIDIPAGFKGQKLVPQALFLCATLFVIFKWFKFWSPFYDKMNEVQDILCDGKLDFVYGIDFLSEIFWTPTLPFGTLDASLTAYSNVVQGIVKQNTDLIRDTTIYMHSPWYFNNRQKLVGAQFVQHYGPYCVDQPSSLGHSPAYYNTWIAHKNLGTMLWSVTGISIYNDSLVTCGDVQKTFPRLCEGHDRIGVLLRFTCPSTCGCSDATSGLGSIGYERYGCPFTSCRKKIEDSLKHRPCSDTPIAELNSTWPTQWRRVSHTSGASFSLHHPKRTPEHTLIELGCVGLSQLHPLKASNLCEHPLGASTFCPVTCKCSQRAHHYEYDIRLKCPAACLPGVVR